MGLAADALLTLLVQEHHPAPGIGSLGRRHQTRQPCSHHDHIGIHHAIVACPRPTGKGLLHRRKNWVFTLGPVSG